MLGKIIGYLLFTIVSLAIVIILGLYYVYSPLNEGTLYLKHAKGEAEVLREVETGIPHVYASSQQMALYSQGFLHGRDRLWQMEKLRRVTQGRLGEIFGERAVQADKFSRVIGFYRTAKETFASMGQTEKDLLQAYSDGVNDFINGIDLTSQDATAKLLPPEFYAVGLHHVELWTPVDSICILKLLNFHLSWNWSQDLSRDIISGYSKEIEDLIGEIIPYTSEFSHNLVTIMDDDDLKQGGFWSEQSLLDRHHIANGKKPAKTVNAEQPKPQKQETPPKDPAQQRPEPKKKEEPIDKEPTSSSKKGNKSETPDPTIKQVIPEPYESEKQIPKEASDAKPKEEQKQEAQKNPSKESMTKTTQTEQGAPPQKPTEKPQQNEKKATPDVKAKPEGKASTEHKEPKEEVASRAKPAAEQQEPPSVEDSVTLEDFEVHSYLDDQMASNNWVISGKHTKTGKPLLSSDPHLATQMPSHWYLIELSYEDNYMIGCSYPGVPFVLLGKTKHFAWGVTSVLADVSDLFKEKFNEEGTHYYVDGKWKELKAVKEEIYVKGKDKPYTYFVQMTHRGPVLDRDSINGAQVLFSGGIPTIKEEPHYSFSWSGYIPKENVVTMLKDYHKIKDIQTLNKNFNALEVYASVPQNLIFAFENGDIAYLLAASAPIRKNMTPFSGCKVLDGTNSDNDWDGYIPAKDLPRVINPKKGYIVTANNRAVTDNAKLDVGTTLTSTARAQRISELIQSGIDKGQKFDFRDMIEIQQDLVDIVARDQIKNIIRIAYTMLDQLSTEQRRETEQMLLILERWHGEMVEESIGATIYATWQYFFYQSLFHSLVSDLQSIMVLTNNYPFVDYYQRMITVIKDDPKNQRFNQVCAGGYSEYKGSEPCAYNIARALSDSQQFLVKEVSSKVEDWEWRNVHVNEYANQPWSMTYLKPLFHREVPVGGNGNTINVSKYNMKKLNELKAFKGTHTANYKQVVQFGDTPQDNIAYFSIDGGQNGNLFAGHYFDMNRRHLDGDLFPMIAGKAAVQQVETEILYLKKLAAKPQAKVDPSKESQSTSEKAHKENKNRRSEEF